MQTRAQLLNMTPPKRVLLLIAIMAVISLAVEAVAIGMLYRAAFREERARLVETVKSQACLIEAVARFDTQYSRNYPKGAREATLRQVMDAHAHYEGFGETGEFTLSEKEGSMMVFLLSHRHGDRPTPKPVPFESKLAEPMRRALSGQSGTVIGLDYRGAVVLAAHEPLTELNLGLVAKIDLAEVRAPFVRASVVSALVGLIVVAAGAALFFRVTEPLLTRLKRTVSDLEAAMNRVKVLSGLLPICANCKKIRDDEGQWHGVESYIRDRSEAEFSHGLCPPCVAKLYPDLDLTESCDPEGARSHPSVAGR